MTLAFRNVRGGYGRGFRRRVVLDGIEVALPSASVTAVVGANGAGKSSLLRLAAGVLRPWSGRVELLHRDGRVVPARTLRIVLVPEAVALPPAPTLERCLRYAAFLAGVARERVGREVVRTATRMGLGRRLNVRVGDLSHGEARRAVLACALTGRPDVLLLDEPWRGLDRPASLDLCSTLRAEAVRGALVVVTSHALGRVRQVADRVLLMSRGRIVADMAGPVAAGDIETRLRRAEAG